MIGGLLKASAARSGLLRQTFRPHQRGAAAAAAINVRCFSSPPQGSPSSFDPDILDKTPEEMRLDYISYKESEYKHGKHRCNALELVQSVPPIEVDREYAICDGGGGALGHPVEYISLARPGVVETCKYCGLRYTMAAKKSEKWSPEPRD